MQAFTSALHDPQMIQFQNFMHCGRGGNRVDAFKFWYMHFHLILFLVLQKGKQMYCVHLFHHKGLQRVSKRNVYVCSDERNSKRQSLNELLSYERGHTNERTDKLRHQLILFTC
jgi:hypothetical protein